MNNIKKLINKNIENEQETIDLTAIQFRLIHSTPIDTEYLHMASGSETVLVHDGRTIKLFDKNIRPITALDLTVLMKEQRSKLVDICYASLLHAYLRSHWRTALSKITRISCLLFFAVSVGCGNKLPSAGTPGKDGASGPAGATSLTEVTTVGPDQKCVNGGVVARLSGLYRQSGARARGRSDGCDAQSGEHARARSGGHD